MLFWTRDISSAWLHTWDDVRDTPSVVVVEYESVCCEFVAGIEAEGVVAVKERYCCGYTADRRHHRGSYYIIERLSRCLCATMELLQLRSFCLNLQTTN